MKTNKRFLRSSANLRYQKLFLIAVEGSETEIQYFELLKQKTKKIVQIKCLKSSTNSSPVHVLNRMKKYLRATDLRKGDEAWVVTDRDSWKEEQLTQLAEWSKEKSNYNFAISNPNFEYWILLHFEDGNSIGSKGDILARIKRFDQYYDKTVKEKHCKIERIESAIRRAKNRDNIAYLDWPRQCGVTTIYKLVERILSDQN